MKAWLKGGLIGLIIAFIFYISYYLCGKICSVDSCVICAFIGIPLWPITFITIIFVSYIPYYISYILGISFYFLIGAIIGWLIGKKK